MKTLKQICKKNWYIIAITLLFAVCSEVLCGIMLHDSFIWSYGPYEFYVRVTSLLPVLAAGCLITYFTAGYLDSKHSLTIALISAVGCLLYADKELNYYISVNYGFFVFCFITATVSLAFYYVNYCRNSAKNTVRYTLMLAFFALLTFEETEFYTILAMHVFLFVTKHKSFEKLSVKVLNWISAGVSAAAFIGALDTQIIDGLNYTNSKEEEGFVLLKEMMSTLKPFGKSEIFDEAVGNGYIPNILKIFGCYGYVVGIVMVILFMIFTASILIVCSRSQGRMKLAVQIAAITLAVRTFTSLLEAFGIGCFFESSIMFVSLNSGEFTAAGVIIGLIFAADKEMITEGAETNEIT